MSDATATAAVQDKQRHKKKHKTQNESGARTCLQAWTGEAAPLSEIRDSVAATGLLMNYTLRSSHRRELERLPGGLPAETKKKKI